MIALVVIDLRCGILRFPTAHPVDDVVRPASALGDAFRGHGLQVVQATVAGAPTGRTERSRRGGGGQRPDGWADLVPELNRQPADHPVTKRTWGAFTNTGLDEDLKNLGSGRSSSPASPPASVSNRPHATRTSTGSTSPSPSPP